MPRMSSDRPNWAPDSIDLDLPNAARIYDYLLGGAANFETDREFAEKLLEVIPEARTAARMNRAFLRRAVRFCVSQGITQFLDIGSGMPTAGNVHEIAPDARVMYVDNDPVAVTHSKLLLRDNPNATCVLGDLTDPEPVIESAFLDFSQPVAVLTVSVLHFVPDEAGPQDAVARYVSALAPGSLLVLSHAVVRAGEQVEDPYERSATPGVPRTRAQITAFFDGLEFVEPGLVWTPEWRPESPGEVGDDPASALVIAGVARKP
jgi:SAM-dependent methyltransferase